ncbi:hypothetical protein EI94DRAFT_1747866 [Lactarius quietus]|nr:hypothetical protein EI94DRAFT_1747866 [Lactarius quietus]
MPFSHDDELTTPIYHRVRIDAIDRGSSRAPPPTSDISASPFLNPSHPTCSLRPRACMSWLVIGSSSDVSYPSGIISRSTPSRAMTISNTERQDFVISVIRAEGFRKHFRCAGQKRCE